MDNKAEEKAQYNQLPKDKCNRFPPELLAEWDKVRLEVKELLKRRK